MINQPQQPRTSPTDDLSPCQVEMIRAQVYGAHALLRRDVGRDLTANDIQLPAYRQVDLVAVIADLCTGGDYLGTIIAPPEPREAIARALETADPGRGADLLRRHGDVDWPGFPKPPLWLTEAQGTFDNFEQVAQPFADLLAVADANGWPADMLLLLGMIRYEYMVDKGFVCVGGGPENRCSLCEGTYPSVPAAGR